MIARCHNPNDWSYDRYGARGITVCERWRESFEAYLEDVGHSPGPEYSLDRKDNNEGYHPGNVRWATSEEQSRNRRTNRTITLDGESKLITEWAEEYGIKPATLWARLKVHGWSLEEALTIKPSTGRKKSGVRGKSR